MLLLDRAVPPSIPAVPNHMVIVSSTAEATEQKMSACCTGSYKKCIAHSVPDSSPTMTPLSAQLRSDCLAQKSDQLTFLIYDLE